MSVKIVTDDEVPRDESEAEYGDFPWDLDGEEDAEYSPADGNADFGDVSRAAAFTVEGAQQSSASIFSQLTNQPVDGRAEVPGGNLPGAEMVLSGGNGLSVAGLTASIKARPLDAARIGFLVFVAAAGGSSSLVRLGAAGFALHGLFGKDGLLK